MELPLVQDRWVRLHEGAGKTRAAGTHRSGRARSTNLWVKTRHGSQEMEAQQQALAAVEAVVQGLSPEQQLELRNQLHQVLCCVASLRSEVAELKEGLQVIARQIIQDVKPLTVDNVPVDPQPRSSDPRE
ncbi:unnamed protein product [Oreochromis niloticus]|nr:unnamed protein product [Mustela putorius furo]